MSGKEFVLPIKVTHDGKFAFFLEKEKMSEEDFQSNELELIKQANEELTKFGKQIEDTFKDINEEMAKLKKQSAKVQKELDSLGSG